MKKSSMVWISLLLCAIGFIIPFFIGAISAATLSTLSLSLTIVGTIAGVVTLIIAVKLYDRFGLEGKFVEKQLDKVLELADALKGKQINILMGEGEIYFMRPHQGQLKTAHDVPEYADNYNKIVLFNRNDYQQGTKLIFAIQRSYWLPENIKNKMKFLTIHTLRSIDEISPEKYVRLSFDANNWDGEWMLSRPEITLDQFNNGLFELVKEIEDWIKQHSSVGIDLRLEEPH